MNPVNEAWALAAFVSWSCVAGWMYVLHGEVFRPMLGVLLFKKRVIPNYVDIEGLFALGNNGKKVSTFKELDHSFDVLRRAVYQQSYYRLLDLRALEDCKRRMFNELYLKNASKNRTDEWARAYTNARRAADQREAQSPPKMPQATGWRATLGLAYGESDPTIIKTAYRRLAMKHHPDRGGKNENFQKINKAFRYAKDEIGFR